MKQQKKNWKALYWRKYTNFFFFFLFCTEESFRKKKNFFCFRNFSDATTFSLTVIFDLTLTNWYCKSAISATMEFGKLRKWSKRKKKNYADEKELENFGERGRRVGNDWKNVAEEMLPVVRGKGKLRSCWEMRNEYEGKGEWKERISE